MPVPSPLISLFSDTREADPGISTDGNSIFLNFSTTADQELPCIATAVMPTRHASIVKARNAVVIGDCIISAISQGGVFDVKSHSAGIFAE